MKKENSNVQFYLFNGVMALIGLFLSLCMAVIVTYAIDLIFNKPPKMSYLAQKAYNHDISGRISWEVFIFVFIITFISLTIYYFFKLLKKSRTK